MSGTHAGGQRQKWYDDVQGKMLELAMTELNENV